MCCYSVIQSLCVFPVNTSRIYNKSHCVGLVLQRWLGFMPCMKTRGAPGEPGWEASLWVVFKYELKHVFTTSLTYLFQELYSVPQALYLLGHVLHRAEPSICRRDEHFHQNVKTAADGFMKYKQVDTRVNAYYSRHTQAES